MRERRALGGTGIDVTPIGLGCWQFSAGQGLGGVFWEALPQATVNEVVGASLEAGVNWFDTAQMYGNGASEKGLASALEAAGKKSGDVVVATKWSQVLRTARGIAATIDERLACLAPFPVDLHQVHHPYGLSSIEAEMGAMADLVAAKKIRAVGVSNFSASQMRRAHAALAAHGLSLGSNQVKYSLVERRIESNGVLDAARELGVAIIAFSPLGQGILTGRYHDDPASIRTRPGPRKWMRAFRSAGLERTRPLVDELKAVARAHGAMPAQVALAWLIQSHGDAVVAIPGASRAAQAWENAGAMELTLSKTELDRLEATSRPFR